MIFAVSAPFSVSQGIINIEGLAEFCMKQINVNKRLIAQRK